MVKRFIDSHTHTFNARYLPLHGIILQFAPDVSARMAKFLARFVAGLCGSSRMPGSRAVEWGENELLGAPKSTDAPFHPEPGVVYNMLVDAARADLMKIVTGLRSGDGRLDGEVDEVLNDLVEIVGEARAADDSFPDVVQELRRLSVAQELDEVEAADLTDMLARKVIDFVLTEIEKNAIYEAPDNSQPRTFVAKEQREDKSAFGGYDWPVLLRFFGRIMLEELDSHAELRHEFGRYETKLVGGLSILLDMEHAFRRRHQGQALIAPKHDFGEQLKRIAYFADRVHGRTLAFGGVDPFRPDWRNVLDRISDLTMPGVKIYCSMGFQPKRIAGYVPYYNPIYFPHRVPAENSDEVDQTVSKILAECLNKDLAVFTHCTPIGFEAKEGYGLNCDPRYWRAVLESAPEMAQLRLCLGHAGGVTNIDWGGWAASGDYWPRTFASTVVELCCEFPNVYCEVGNWEKMFDDAERSVILDNLERALRQQPAAGQFSFAKKIMFGTDLHMVDMVKQGERFLGHFEHFFQDRFGPDTEMQDDFFYGNAARFLRIPDVSVMG